jgi:hypothetical protein
MRVCMQCDVKRGKTRDELVTSGDSRGMRGGRDRGRSSGGRGGRSKLNT